MLTTHPVTIETLSELREFVNEVLCEHHQLELDAFPMTERILVRADRPCGIYFCLHGPRQVKFSAIYETQGNTILFYGSNGERFHKTHLVQAPSLEPAIA